VSVIHCFSDNYHLSCIFGVCCASGSAYHRPATSDIEVTQFFTDSQPSVPVLPPRRSSSILHWKDPPPSPPAERSWTGSNVFSDSMVCEFFGRSSHLSSLDAVNIDCHNDLIYHQDEATSSDGNFVPCSLSSSHPVGWDGSVSQTSNQAFDPLMNSYSTCFSAPADNDVDADCNVVFHSGEDGTVRNHSLADVDSTVTGVNGDGLSAFCYSLRTQQDVDSASSEDAHNMGLWKRFDNSAWEMEQEKLKQMSLDLPSESVESDSRDDQLPDLSSSNRLSMAALRLYDSIYGGQPTSSAHRVPSTRSLSSVWMRDQNEPVARTPDQSALSFIKQNSDCGPSLAEHRTEISDVYSRNVCELEVGRTQPSPSSFLPQTQLAQPVSSPEQSPATEEKYDYTSKTSYGIPETLVPTESVSAGFVAEAISQLGLSEKDVYGAYSLGVDNYRWQTSATPTHVPHPDVSRTAVEDVVLARRPSIKELKSRFEAETSSDSRLPSSSSAATRRRQFESSSLKVGRHSFQGRTDPESGQKQRRKPSIDVVAPASSYADNSSRKNSASKGRFVTRSSIAASTLITLPVLSAEAGVDQAEHRRFERLVDRRKVFEAADTQPVA